jgi:restriction system protein
MQEVRPVEYVVAFVLFVVLYAVFVWRKARQQRTGIRKLVRTHLKTLVLKRARGFTRDDYGRLVDTGWSKEIAYFYEHVIPKQLRTDHGLSDVADLIEQEIAKLPDSTLEQWTMASAIATGEEFEHFVSGQLEASGWSVRHTGKSGDQGADLVAGKPGVTVAVQCKLYAQPVGNKAVQEALAAQRYYATDHAAVVSNAAFTKSAVQLARSADVLLLHPSDLDRLDDLVDGTRGAQAAASL